MKYIFKYLLAGVLLTVLAVACTSEDFQSPTNNDEDAVIISAGVNMGTMTSKSTTRAADAAWEANDHIGITMLSTAAIPTVVNEYKNRDYVTEGTGSFTSNPENNKMYYPTDGSDVTFKAYYPYKGLGAYPTYPVNVSGQSDIAGLDLMTAVHKNADESTANSKDKKEAHLVFYHRLAMAIVNVKTDTGSPIDLTGAKLAVKGLKTTGNYDLITDTWLNKENVQDINIPLGANNTGRAILLPREAGEGVTFEVTTKNGGVYTAALDKDLELKSGSKYTFNLTLKTTPALITASIEDWVGVPARGYDVIHVVTTQGVNEGFKQNDQLKLYIKDNGDSDYAYSKGGTFTFDGTKWGIATPIYWENLIGPTDFRATSVFAGKLNNTQMDDYLVGETPGVDLYQGVHLDMKHAGTKVTVKLSSSDGTYSATDLENATVTLPGYLNNGLLNPTTGEYSVGASTGNIIPEKQGTGNPKDRVAIFPAQIIVANATLVKVVINEHTYEVKDASAFTYEQGKHHVITLNIQKSGIQITTKVIDWIQGQKLTKNVTIGSATLGANSDNLLAKDELYLYTDSKQEGIFTYNATTKEWNANSPIYWENISGTGKLYASITRPEVNNTSTYNQSKDYITAEPILNHGGVGNTAIHFEMKHRVAKVNVKLASKNTELAAKLKDAEVTLPNYEIGGTMANGVYTLGTNTGTITVGPLNASAEASAYLQPQSITTGATVAVVKVAGRTYNVKFGENVEYKEGYYTNLTINIEPSEVKVSVNVAEWGEINHSIALSFSSTDASASGFKDDDKIKFYKLGTGSTVAGNTDYIYSGDVNSGSLSSNTPWYRDDFQTGDKITAVFPADKSNLTSGNTFNWTSKSSGETNDRKDDILVAAPDANNGVIKEGSANVSLHFKHMLSKVTVNIFRGEGFTEAEFNSLPGISLRNFKLSGSVDVAAGTATATGSATDSFVPTKLTESNTVQNFGKAVASYEAFIMPQIIGTTGTKTAIVGVVLNKQTYLAEIESYDFKAGENHVFNITLKKTGLIFSATVAPWQNGTGGSIVIE